jgi:hypothetical protein
VEEADDRRRLVQLRQILLTEHIATENLTAVLDQQVGRGAAQQRGVHGQAELPINQLLLFRSRHGLHLPTPSDLDCFARAAQQKVELAPRSARRRRAATNRKADTSHHNTTKQHYSSYAPSNIARALLPNSDRSAATAAGVTTPMSPVIINARQTARA